MSEEICIDPQDNDGPRTLRDPRERERRIAMLTMPHVAPLVHYTAGLRERDGVEVPEFDPLDGGVNAKYLFLFEKPGPMTAAAGRRTGSGFISRNNDDPTAEAAFNFMRQAGIPRRATVIWNVIPWWNGTRKIAADEIRDGADSFVSLRGYLPKLSAVVMVGEKAARLQASLKGTGLELFQTCHPSPLVRARFRSRWEAIPVEWSRVLGVGSRREVN